MKAFYSDTFELPLPAGHRFPIEKYRRLRERLQRHHGHMPIDLLAAPAVTRNQLMRAHTAGYLERLFCGTLTQLEQRRIGFPWSQQMVRRCQHSAGGTLAAAAGADFLCYVTPSEHLRLPSVEDVHEGVMASRIAAHAADIVKQVPGAIEKDHAMAKCRKELDWEGQFALAIDPEKARRLLAFAESASAGPGRPGVELDLDAEILSELRALGYVD